MIEKSTLLSRLTNYLSLFPSDFAGGWIDEKGAIQTDQPIETWIVARQLYSSCTLLNLNDNSDENCKTLVSQAEKCIDLLMNELYDSVNLGWFSSISNNLKNVINERKTAYDLSFIMLASSQAAQTNNKSIAKNSLSILQTAIEIFYSHFWDDEAKMAHNSFSRNWDECEEYHGANSNLHILEALIAASEIAEDLGFDNWEMILNANEIAQNLLVFSEDNTNRLPEHFDSKWDVDFDFHEGKSDDKFRPHATTVGHSFELSHLLMQLDSSLYSSSAKQIFDSAWKDGWDEKSGGIFYTVDFSGKVQSERKLLWPSVEAFAACMIFGENDKAKLLKNWIEKNLINCAVSPLFKRELDCEQFPIKPDLYHILRLLKV